MVNASGIPRLRRFCRSILDETRLLETKKFLEKDLSSLLRSTELWANSTLDSEQDNISPLSFLENAEFKTIDNIVSTEEEVYDLFKTSILDFSSTQRNDWEIAASEKSREWFAWPSAKYDTWCMKNGNPSPQGSDHVNWNGEFIWKMRSELAIEWDIFEQEIPIIFKDLLRRLKKCLEDVGTYLGGLNPKLTEATRFHSQIFGKKFSLIEREFERDVSVIGNLILEPHEVSYIVREMLPTYRAASEISEGMDKAARQRVIVQGRIIDGKLFGDILQDLKVDMSSKLKGICEKVENALAETFESIHKDVKMILPDVQRDNVAAEERFKKQLGAEVRRLQAKHQEIIHTTSFTSYMLLAECTKYWQFILCLSILGGVSSAVITTVSIAVLSHWFQRRRALASGLCMAGSSAGGAVIPLILQALFARKGWKIAIRIIAFIALGCYTLGVIMVRGRLPGRSSKAMIDFRAFRSLRLCFLTVAVFSFEFIIFGCAALLPTYVRFAGMSTTVQFYSLTVLNSMSFMGRVLPGFAADQFGRFNVLLCLVLVTLVVMAAVWLPWGSHNDATLYAVVAIFGFSSGGWLSLAPVCAGQLCRTEEYGRYYGTIYFVAAFGVLLTVPASGVTLAFTLVHINDVAEVHVKALEPNILAGRYLVSSSGVIRWSHIVAILREKFSGEGWKLKGDAEGQGWNLDTMKAEKGLGLKSRGLDKVVGDTVEYQLRLLKNLKI
ncbi:hypothetical protein TCE0_060f18920 [Talaromyces pinophilus]|uniref:DUF7605 domain-containing protein n=1 Tax=Talaromyces pinophilus TaxID=128442 RepID=A0A6V8HP74_TALPI|nr:hypothetical protein TCE0_060f18920 [Talaromyces pinophilus]